MKNSLNVLLITVRADLGGGPKHVDLLINGLTKVSNIFVACPNDEPYYSLWKQSEKVKGVIQVPHRRFTLQALREIRSFCLSNNIHVVHSHGKGAGIYSRLLKLVLPKVKVIHTYHGLHIYEYSPSKLRAYLFIEKAFSILTTKFINVSHGEQQKCIENKILKPDESVVIYNGIDGLKEIENQKEHLNIGGKFTVATISRFDDQKYMGLAYKIAESLQDIPDICFLWIGDGPKKMALEERVKESGLDNIMFCGFQEDVTCFLNASDLYLSTSKWEGLPFALIEALSLGMPIVATDVVGNNEVVQNGKNGLLFKLDDVKAAKNHILKLYSDKGLYSQLSHAARRDFETRFLKDKMVSQIEMLYNEIV